MACINKKLCGSVSSPTLLETRAAIGTAISVNGAAAHKAQVGDLLIIASYASYSEVEVKNYAPTLNMGVAYNVLGKYQEAIDAFEKAIKINPDFHEAHRNLENAFSVNGAAAHKAQVGDLLIIASYASYSEVEVKNYAPTLCYVDANNVLTQIKAALKC
jgi:aspartate 1-decarboxylase